VRHDPHIRIVGADGGAQLLGELTLFGRNRGDE